MSTFTMAPELATRADKLIRKHHTHLKGIPILYVWRDKATRAGGRLVLGKASRLTGRNAYLVGAAIAGQGELYDYEHDDDQDHTRFVIEIAADVWLLLTDDNERDALLDHELSHCRLDDEGRLVLRDHDVSEFAHIVKRYGLWRDDLREFGEAVEHQLSLELEPEPSK